MIGSHIIGWILIFSVMDMEKKYREEKKYYNIKIKMLHLTREKIQQLTTDLVTYLCNDHPYRLAGYKIGYSPTNFNDPNDI